MNYQELIDLFDKFEKSNLRYLEYHGQHGRTVLAKDALPDLPKENQVKAEPQVMIAEESIEENSSLSGSACTAPMVGVVYLKPNPQSDNYVEVGDHVEAGDVLCLIEAMKLMNEIVAPQSGTVTKVLVENEQIVEYDQPLFVIE